MPDQTITCPQCDTNIPLTEALSQKIKSEMESELKAEHAKELKAVKKQAEELERAKKELEKREKSVEEGKKELQEELKKQLEAEKKKVEAAAEKKLAEEKKQLWQKAQEKAKEQQGKALKDLTEQLEEKSKKLAETEKIELELRKKSRELEEKAKKQELEMARKLDEERKKIEDTAKKQEAEQFHLKLKEKDKKMEIMQKTIADLKRQAEQGSMQIQGEVQEDDLKQLLTQTFMMDEITDVPTGVRGADLVQKINAKIGARSGTIIWESKNTKSFSDSWISKLKSDQGKVRAEIAILVSQAMPEDIQSFGLRNGVWVVGYPYAIALATCLRFHISEVSKVKRSLDGRDEKMDQLYRYLTGPQFKNRVENMVMAFMNMKQDLETEKRSLNRIWNKREKEIERMLLNTSNLYGDLQGIIGGSLPTIQSLELPAGEENQGLFE